MTALQQLEIRISQIERRVRMLVSSRGMAAFSISALVLTLVLVYIANQYRFANVLPFRIALFAALAMVLAFAIVLPLVAINRRRIARRAESIIEDLDGRLLTVTERPDAGNPFTELIAADVLEHLHSQNTEQLSRPRLLYLCLGLGASACAVLIWLIAAGPGYWGYGSSLLWTGTAHPAARPLYDIAVQPGNRTIRRRSDQVIGARLVGFSDRNVTLHAKYRGSTKWDTLPMSPQPGSDRYQFLFAGLADSLDYYVQAGGIASRQYTIAVKDLPVVQRLRVEVHFPAGLGLSDSIDDPGGDIRAVTGSQARLSVLTDKPLQNGTLVLDDGSKVPLSAGQGPWLTASLPIRKDGAYHVAELDEKETVRISDDYFIEAKKDEPPSVRIVRPGRDPQVSPIEEVPVTVEASDDFGVRSVQLHYSVNGGPEQVKTLAQSENAKEATGKTTLYFEDFKLQPGDLVSFYATARDASQTSRTDIVFAQAQPFDFKFRQSQQDGGGMGSGDAGDQTRISERQKEIIAATWNELKTGKQDTAVSAENARFLSGLEGKLGDQAKALASRMGSRDLTSTSPEFEQFSKLMTQASADMGSAVDQLKPGKWNEALGPEQKALQSLLRGEAIFRDIQVAYGQRGGNGMSAGGQQRELARLFDLELDQSKNQYETGQSLNQPSSDQQKKLDDALERLKELARRQQELAQQQRPPDQQFQQRWEEEQLRREAEQLRQEMQQMTQNSASGSPSSSAGSSGGQTQATRQALDSVRRAEDEMRDAVSRGDRSAQSRAAQQLAQAQDALSKMQHQQNGNNMSDLAQQAHQLTEQQKQLAEQIKGAYGAAGINTADPNQTAEGQMPEMSGPDYGGWYRSRMYAGEGRPATPKEKSLAQNSDQLAQQMQQLQQQLQQQAQSMSAGAPESGRQLRKALSQAEQQDLALRMQKNAQWLREGYGSQVWPLEDSITAGMQQLTKRLDQVAESVNKEDQQGSASPDAKLQQALSAVRSLREQLQSRTQSGTAGGRSPSVSDSGDGAQAALNQLYSLRSQFGRNDRQFDNTLANAIGSLRRIQSDSRKVDAILNQDAVTGLARVELELTRKLTGFDANPRTGVPENIPEQYREALAKYYRQLSN